MFTTKKICKMMKEVSRKSVENGNHSFQGGEVQRRYWANWRLKNNKNPYPDDWKYLSTKEGQ